MADKLAGSDAEDVLSSVRRLVSDESVLRNAVAASQAVPERLLLTPALRVVIPADREGVDPVPELPASLLAPDTLDDLPADVVEDLKSLGALEATIAELEAAVEGHAEFEPDGGDENSVLDYPPKLVHAARASGEAAEEAEGSPRRRLTLGVPDGAPEVPDTPADDSPPPDLSGTLRLVARQETPPPAEAAETEDEILLDEESLRQMVVEIIREELQGAMGERITSNIRKLIRREIHDYFDVRDDE